MTVPVPAQFFTPFATEISGISQSNPAIVTTNSANGYANNLFIRIVFPYGGNFGMPQLNGEVYPVTVIDSENFSIPVDTTQMVSFSIGTNEQVPQCIPVSESGTFFNEAVVNDGTIKPAYNWTNTTFPWVNNPNYRP